MLEDEAVSAPEFIDFMVWPRNGNMRGARIVRVGLKQPVRLYDETPLSGYRKARAVAWRIARQELEQSPSMPMRAEPHDWSDGVEALSGQVPA